jgi:tRNA(Ile)-lysidine synthase
MVVKLLQQFREHWAVKRYVLPGEIVLLAVSGGGDSMVMADLFLKSEIMFAVAHCNFGLRGVASDLDEQLVTDWCRVNGIRFHRVQFETKARSEEWKKRPRKVCVVPRKKSYENTKKLSSNSTS